MNPITPPLVYLVTHGQYADTQPLAVFEDQTDAQDFADQWNLDNLTEISNEDDRAVVATQLPFYRRGSYAPQQ